MRRPLQVTEQWIESFDGTRLAVHEVGSGQPVLLCNGLGGSWRAWTHQLEFLSDRYRFISWDYRGLYRSPPPPEADALRVEDHARDALAVLDAVGVGRTALFGWSMGVQVSLEVFRRAPDRVAALMLMSGVAGRPWETVMNFKPMGWVLPHLLRRLQTVPRLVELVTRRTVQWPETLEWVKRIGLASATLDDEVFQELAESFIDLDLGLYLRTLELLGEHDARDVLPEVDVPTLVIVGDRDVFTPRQAAERMVRTVPAAELLLVAGGTHYVAVEYPELVNLRVEKFFRERGYAPSPRVA